MDKLRKDVVDNIRACLISKKGSSNLRSLKSDYMMLMGEDIPYRKLGCKSLEEFISSIDSLRTSKTANGEMLVDAKASNETSHIVDMIARQKTTVRKRAKYIPSRLSKRTYAPVNRYQSTKWRPKNITSSNSYQSSPRPAAVSHNQFVKHPKSPEKQRDIPPRYLAARKAAMAQSSDKENKPVEVQNVPQSTPVNYKQYENDKCPALTNTKMRLVRKMTDMSIDSDASSSTSDDATVSARNRIMKNVAAQLSPPPLERSLSDLYRESMMYVDPNSSLWTNWTSSDDSSGSRNGFVLDLPQFESNCFAELERFVAHHKLPDFQVKFVERKVKRKGNIYDCRIKVAKYSYSSYPEEFSDKELSKQYTARIALDDLMPKYGRKKSLLLSTERDVLERIPPIVQKHVHGIWNMQLEADYADMYNEQLPINWLEIVDISPNIYVEPLLDNRFILRYCKKGEVFQKSVGNFAPPMSGVSVPANTITFDEKGLLTACIVSVVSAAEFWCRQRDIPECDSFEDMMVQMNDYYNVNGQSLRAISVSAGGYFVAYYENYWVRVRILEVNGNDVHCFCIDDGEEVQTTTDNIYQLLRTFAIEQAQAFVCRLAGLEDLYEVSAHSECMQKLLYKDVQLEVPFDSPANVIDPTLPVIICDATTGINLNKEMISLISIESASPLLNEVAVTEVYPSHIESNGDIFVQVQTPGYNELQNLLCELEKTVLSDPHIAPVQITPENSEDRLFFIKYKEDNCFYRAQVLDLAPTREYAQMYFVDYGNACIIKCMEEKGYPLDEIHDVVSLYPHQAVKVRLAIPEIPSNFLEQAKTLMPYGEPVLLKIIERDQEGVPIVEIFKRTEPDNYLVSLNRAIAMESECRIASGDGNNNTSAKNSTLERLISLMNQFDVGLSSKNVPSTGLLKCPPLPAMGEYFDVKVPCAVNPWNFFVQPYEYNQKLGALMTGLQERYKDVLYSPLTMNDIQPGRIYASKHEDGHWYRTSVIKVIHAGSISVFYCDFGYYANLTRQQLIPLDADFMDLPYQAVKAKLAGIKPKNLKWTMEDCKYFQKLVCKKLFVSVLISTESDELYRCDKVLNMKLIDTSTSDDVYIDRLLVQKSIAVDS